MSNINQKFQYDKLHRKAITQNVKMQKRKKFSVTNVTACLIPSDGNNALAFCLHPEAVASSRRTSNSFSWLQALLPRV